MDQYFRNDQSKTGKTSLLQLEIAYQLHIKSHSQFVFILLTIAGYFVKYEN